MHVQIAKNTTPITIKPGITRRIAHLEKLLTAVITFENGPMEEPDPPHSHPHEQITYVAEGELYFLMDNKKHRLQQGDMFMVPSGMPHTIQTLTAKVVLIDSFSPVREDFLED
ncbi:MAG: cupin domain-containing protein [Bacteroidota bacterium]